MGSDLYSSSTALKSVIRSCYWWASDIWFRLWLLAHYKTSQTAMKCPAVWPYQKALGTGVSHLICAQTTGDKSQWDNKRLVVCRMNKCLTNSFMSSLWLSVLGIRLNSRMLWLDLAECFAKILKCVCLKRLNGNVNDLAFQDQSIHYQYIYQLEHFPQLSKCHHGWQILW